MTPEDSATYVPETPTKKRRRPLRIALGLLLVAGVAAAVVFLATSGSSDRLVIGEPRIVNEDELSSYSESANRPVYWAGGAADGFKLELTELEEQRVFLRYLTEDAKAGDPQPAYTTIATYPMDDAQGELEKFSDRPGSVEGEGANGATTLYYKKTPSNVYVAQPDSDYLVEVYAPEPAAALTIAKSSKLTTVE